MYQRSCDMGPGALQHRELLPAHLRGAGVWTKPAETVHCCGDTVYSNHVEPLYKQLENEPRPFPTLKINPEKKDIDSFEFSDFEIVDYDPHPKIAMQMAV